MAISMVIRRRRDSGQAALTGFHLHFGTTSIQKFVTNSFRTRTTTDSVTREWMDGAGEAKEPIEKHGNYVVSKHLWNT